MIIYKITFDAFRVSTSRCLFFFCFFTLRLFVLAYFPVGYAETAVSRKSCVKIELNIDRFDFERGGRDS